MPVIVADPNFRYMALAAAMGHMEGFFSTESESFKHFNPGNIETPKGENIHYLTITAGWMALYYDIHANAGKTLREFIRKYAPPNENNTSEYLTVVSVRSGIAPDDIL